MYRQCSSPHNNLVCGVNWSCWWFLFHDRLSEVASVVVGDIRSTECPFGQFSFSWLFLPRDAMSKRGLRCCPVSVRPSVRHVGALYRDGWRYRQTSFAPSFQFFDSSADTQFQGEPLQQGRKIHGVGKFWDFRLKSPSISETVQDRPMVTMER